MPLYIPSVVNYSIQNCLNIRLFNIVSKKPLISVVYSYSKT